MLGCREHTWEVSGHHYALVDGRGPGARARARRTRCASTASAAWPPLDASPPAVAHPHAGRRRRRSLAFGSCRYGRAAAKLDRQALRRRLAGLLRPRAGATQDEARLARRDPHARRPGLRRRDVRGDAARASGPGATSPTRRQGPGRRLRGVHLALPRVVDRPGRALAAVQRPVVDDLRRPRRARRLEHLARVARGHAAARRGGRSASPAACRRTGSTSTWATSRPPSCAANELYQRVRAADGDVDAAAARVRRRTPTPRPTAPRARGGPTAATSAGCGW